MTIQHKETENRGHFFVTEDEDIVAGMTYIRHDSHTMIINHTEVDEVLQGQNIGFRLIEAGVEFARLHHLKIIPVCVFAAAIFDKKPEFRDVLKEEQI